MKYLRLILITLGFVVNHSTILRAQQSETEINLGAMVQPVPQNNKFQLPGYYVWCGSVIKGKDEKFYMLYSRWQHKDGFFAWAVTSEIAVAVADKPEGPFKHLKVVLPARGTKFWDGSATHNPMVITYKNKYYLFYMGTSSNAKLKLPTGMDGNWWQYRNTQRIGVAVADNPAGEWKRLDKPILDVSADSTAFDALMVSNPAPCVGENGKIILMYKQVSKNGTLRGGRVRMAVAFADSPLGPYKKEKEPIFEVKDGDKEWMLAEDPFVFFQNKKYYAVVRDVVGKFSGDAGAFALMVSTDGKDWKAAKYPKVIGSTFIWEKNVKSASRLERPCLYIENGVPKVLYGATRADWSESDSYNVAIPLLPENYMKASPFSLEDVKLFDSPFKKAHDVNIQYIFRLNADRLLSTFRTNAGIENAAGIKPYGGWESADCGLCGHTTGHYLSALSYLHSTDKNTLAKEKLDFMVSELKKCQDKFPNGYLSAFPETVFDEIEKTGDGWAPHYTIHKILQGLIDAYTMGENKAALECAVKMGDWLTKRCDAITDRDAWQIIFDKIETGGICESLANLAIISGDKKYLKTAEFFVQDSKYFPALNGIDNLNGKITGNYHHANTTIPQFIGLLRLYQTTGNTNYLKASEFFWQQVALHRSYATGGTGFHEHWNFGPDTLGNELDYQAQETCCSYNMLKLSKDLFCENVNSRYFDYYEKVLYNHILASQNPENGRMIYMLSLRPGHWKMFGNEEDAFWCCQGTGIENHNKYGEAVYFKNETDLFVNLFIASQVNWKEKGINIEQNTDFPQKNSSTLKVTGNSAKFTLQIRIPNWTKGKLNVWLNGKNVKNENQIPGYFSITRNWKNNDEVKIDIPMEVRTETLPDDSTKFAILYGPIVLAAALGKDQMPDINTNNTYFNPPPDQLLSHELMPEIVFSNQIKENITRKTTEKLSFILKSGPSEFALKPLYEIYDEKYHIYWQRKKLEQLNK